MMPRDILKHKISLSEMTAKEFAERYRDSDDNFLKEMAWRHGYGKNSTYYVDKRKHGKEIL